MAAAKKAASGKKSASAKKAASEKKSAAASEKKSAPEKKAASEKKSAAAKKAAPEKKSAAAKKAAPTPQAAPKLGGKAPDFKLQTDTGEEVSLKDFRGKNLVLYFYPRDMTPGCTVEACGFRDSHAAIQKQGAVVLGVSRDSPATHTKFKAKENLPFTLLSDPTGEMIASYGSWGEKSFMGRKFPGILRTTVLIDGEGKIRKVFPKVSPKTHAAEVIEALGELR